MGGNMKPQKRYLRILWLAALIAATGIITLHSAKEVRAQQNEAALEERKIDPWEPFNDKMFWFNKNVLDRFIVKPLATGWNAVVPTPVQKGLHNMFDNAAVTRRLVNNLLEANLGGAGREVARFTINSTIGVVGFFDVAGRAFGIRQSDADTGVTLGVWGVGPGPYLVLPFLPPLDVRDGIGYAFDAAMTPYVYFLPWYANMGIQATNVVNERSLNLDTYQQVEESVIDLYSGVRDGYLQRREAKVEAAKNKE